MKRVVIEVRSGMAYVIEKPKDVRVVIRDYDVQGIRDWDLQTNENGRKYIEKIIY